jgi:glycosyltransferase involved in cell wall biosynthesis
MQVSVVIGTYDRARLLQGTLQALASQEAPDCLKWEIIVVDNNSRDTTAQVVTAFSKTTATPVRYLFEARQGVSHARNRGIREARGSIIAFTDDDILPAPDWIAQVAAAMDRWNAYGVGGRILPRWETSPPIWLTENRDLLDRLSIMDFEASHLLELPLKRPQVWGANMAFRRELFERVGEFDPRRGIIGKKLFRGEETDLISRALELGLTIAYDAALTVFHRIGSDRMRRAYFRKLSFDNAQGGAVVRPVVSGRSFLGAPLGTYRAAFTRVVKWGGLLLLRRPEAFDQQLGWLESLGQLSGYWKGGSGKIGVSRPFFYDRSHSRSSTAGARESMHG